MRVSLNRVLVGLVVVVLIVGLLPTGVILDRQLVAALEARTRADLASALLILTDRFANQASTRMMHAKEVAGSPSVAAALMRGDSAAALKEVTAIVAAFPNERPVLLSREGATLSGPAIPPSMLASARAGAMPVQVVHDGGALATVALAPVKVNERWVGAAGTWVPVATEEAASLSVLTRSNVLITAPNRDLIAYTGAADAAMGVVGALARTEVDGVRELVVGGQRYFLAAAALPGGARVMFVRPAEGAMAIVPALRRAAAVALGTGLLIALLAGTWAAKALTRPVAALSKAAERVAGGDRRAPLPRSSIVELDRMAASFVGMRDALATRIDELDDANRELAARQDRLGMLQAELIQRERLSSTTRLLVQLAHEIRNPVAGVRNALELLRRRVRGDGEATEFAELAIDELLRMHELAEHMLDVHRPRSDQTTCDAAAVVRDVAAVMRLTSDHGSVSVEADAAKPVVAAIGADSLKQVLLNLVQNAREAVGSDGRIVLRAQATAVGARIDVEDDGPGIAAADLPRLFDAFFTTKTELHGVGLGLYIAQGIVRGQGGRLLAENRAEGGARFTFEVPAAAANA